MTSRFKRDEADGLATGKFVKHKGSLCFIKALVSVLLAPAPLKAARFHESSASDLLF